MTHNKIFFWQFGLFWAEIEFTVLCQKGPYVSLNQFSKAQKKSQKPTLLLLDCKTLSTAYVTPTDLQTFHWPYTDFPFLDTHT